MARTQCAIRSGWKTLAVGMTNGAVRFWDRFTRELLFEVPPAFELNRHEFPNLMQRPYKQGMVAFSPSGKSCAIIGPSEKITIWDLLTRKPSQELHFPREGGEFWTVLFSAENTLLAGVLKFGAEPRRSMVGTSILHLENHSNSTSMDCDLEPLR